MIINIKFHLTMAHSARHFYVPRIGLTFRHPAERFLAAILRLHFYGEIDHSV